MTSYATLLRDHVTLKCRCIDRIFLQAYVPKLQTVGHVCRFLRWQRKFQIPSSAAFGKIGDAYVRAIHPCAERHKIPVVHFKRAGQRKDGMSLFGCGCPGRQGPGSVDRDRAREGIGVAIMAAEGTRESPTPAYGLGPRTSLHQSLLLLCLGCRMGWSILEDQCVCSVSILDLAERPRMGETAVGEGPRCYETLDNGFRACNDPAVTLALCDGKA